MAVSKLRKKGMARSKKTGRTYRVNIKRSRAAKKGARKRLHRHLKPAVKTKISRGIRKALRSKRTKAGRRVLRKVKKVTSKPYSPSASEQTAETISTYRHPK